MTRTYQGNVGFLISWEICTNTMSTFLYSFQDPLIKYQMYGINMEIFIVKMANTYMTV